LDFFGQKLHYFCTPTDSDTLVVIHHGLLGSSLEWYGFQMALSLSGIKSCAYDRPGFGFSPLPQTSHPPSIEENSKNLNELLVLESVGSVKRILHFGHSIGAIYALGYAQTYPSETAGLILLDPVTAESEITAYDKAVSQFNLWTKLGINRFQSLLFPTVNSFDQLNPHHQLIKSISVSDNFATAVNRERAAIPILTNTATKYYRLDDTSHSNLPVLFLISNSFPSLSNIPSEALSSIHNNPSFKHLLKEKTKLTDLSIEPNPSISAISPTLNFIGTIQ